MLKRKVSIYSRRFPLDPISFNIIKIRARWRESRAFARAGKDLDADKGELVGRGGLVGSWGFLVGFSIILHILGDHVWRTKEAKESLSRSRDCIKGVWGSFLRAAVIIPWSMLSCFKVSYSGPQSFTILGLPLKLCIRVSMVWSAWAVVKMIHLRSIFWNKQWGSYLHCIDVGIGFLLL